MSGDVWARGYGVALRAAELHDLNAPGPQRALRDGIERGYEGPLPEPPPGCEYYAIEAGKSVAGALAFVRDARRPVRATIWAVAIAPEHRAHAYGARALFAAERRLRRDGVEEFLARVPRTNGRGLYFMLRCGYAPILAPVEDGATWFRRNPTPAGRSSVVLLGRERRRKQQPAPGSSGGS